MRPGSGPSAISVSVFRPIACLPTRKASTQMNGMVKGLVMKVATAATGRFARAATANSAAKGVCATGTAKPANSPSAAPRATPRRLKRHTSGEARWRAKGRRKRFASSSSRVGIFSQRRTLPASPQSETRATVPNTPCSTQGAQPSSPPQYGKDVSRSLVLQRVYRKTVERRVFFGRSHLSGRLGRRFQPSAFISRPCSRFQSFSFSCARLSCSLRPFATASSTFAFPRALK